MKSLNGSNYQVYMLLLSFSKAMKDSRGGVWGQSFLKFEKFLQILYKFYLFLSFFNKLSIFHF